MIELSKQPLSNGRMLHVFSKHNEFDDRRPGVVVNHWPTGTANVNVFIDGANDGAFLKKCRERPDGNTLASIPVFDPLTEEQRQAIRAAGPESWAGACEYWAEWPPRV